MYNPYDFSCYGILITDITKTCVSGIIFKNPRSNRQYKNGDKFTVNGQLPCIVVVNSLVISGEKSEKGNLLCTFQTDNNKKLG